MNKLIEKERGFKIGSGRLWGGYDLMSNSSLEEKQAIKNLSQKIWESKGENVYEVEFDPKELLYSPLDQLSYKVFFESDLINKIDTNNYKWDSPRELTYVSFELWVKLVWLSTILIKEKNFKYTIGTHFNPVYNEIVIHPGGTRQHALRLFPPTIVKAIHFDTFGNKSKFKNLKNEINIKPIENYPLWCEYNDYQMIFTPDHGTFIPHPMKGNQEISTGKLETFNKIKNILSNFQLKSNIPLPYIKRYSNPNSLNICIVEYKSSPLNLPHYDIVRILILICAGLEWDDEIFKITWNREKII